MVSNEKRGTEAHRQEGVWWASRKGWHENKGQRRESHTHTHTHTAASRGCRDASESAHQPIFQSSPDCTTSTFGICPAQEISNRVVVCSPSYLPLPGQNTPPFSPEWGQCESRREEPSPWVKRGSKGLPHAWVSRPWSETPKPLCLFGILTDRQICR